MKDVEPVSKMVKRQICTSKATSANIGTIPTIFVEDFYHFLELFWLSHSCTLEEIVSAQ
jgi:hypothetical protein